MGWLPTALGAANSAAKMRPRSDVASWPTAYTPRYTGNNRFARTLTATSFALTPAASSCRRDTTPH